MNAYKNIFVLVIFLLFGLNNINSMINQIPSFSLVTVATNSAQDHSSSHDCTSDGDDIISCQLEVAMFPCDINTDLINLYSGNILSKISHSIWQPPKIS